MTLFRHLVNQHIFFNPVCSGTPVTIFLFSAKPVLSTDPNLPNISEKNPVAHLNEMRQGKFVDERLLKINHIFNSDKIVVMFMTSKNY